MQVQCPRVPLNKKCTQKKPISTFHGGERCQTVHPGHSSPLLSQETGSVIYLTVSCGPDPEDLKAKDRQEHGLLHSHFPAAWLRLSQADVVSFDIEGIVIHSCKEQRATTTSNTGSKEGKYINGAG